MATWGNDRRIVLYALRVELDLRVFRKEDKTREPFVANFNGSGGDLLHAISSFVEALPASELVARDMRHFGQPRDIRRQGRTICWRMDGGESGRATSVMLKRGDQWRTRELSGVEREPFWVFAVVPKNANQGWMLIEKHGHHTLPSEWRDELVKRFVEAYHGYRLVIGTVREASLWSQVENSTDDRLLGFEVALRSPDNPSATGHAAGFERGMVRVDRQLYHVPGDAVMGKRLREFRRKWTGTTTPSGIIEIDEPLDYDDLADDKYQIRLRDDVVEIKASVLNARGEPKTIVFEGGRDPVQTIVMSGTSQGQPDRDRFVSECRSTVRDLAQSGGVALPQQWDTMEWEHPADAVAMEVKVDESPGSSDQAEEQS
jgi:hypothetical protein